MRVRAVILACVLAIAACGGGGETAPRDPTTTLSEAAPTTTAPTTATTESATTTSVARREGGWSDLLDYIPSATDMASFVVINDYAAAREALGIDRPGADASEEEIIEYLLTLQMGPVADDSATPVVRSPRMGVADDSFGVQAPYDIAAWHTAFGISVLDVDRTAVAGNPPSQLIVWEGAPIDAATVASAVASDPEWSDILETADTAGLSYYVWGDPMMIDISLAGPVRPIGQAGCLYAEDGFALRTIGAETMESALEVRAGGGTSLAEVGPLLSLATALEDAGAYSALLTLDVGLFAGGGTPLLSDDSEPQPGLLPYLAAATGVGLDGRTTVTLVALIHSSDADAAENADRLRTVIETGRSQATTWPWADFFTVIDISTEGPLLVAALATEGNGQMWLQLAIRRDSLLAWE